MIKDCLLLPLPLLISSRPWPPFPLSSPAGERRGGGGLGVGGGGGGEGEEEEEAK